MFFPFWLFPLISAAMWLATLLAMLITWLIAGSPKYASMSGDQTIAYISDIGAQGLKPLFIAGCVVTTVFLDISFLSDRWLRHRGVLAPNTTWGQKLLSYLAIFFALAGTVGLILLSIFDTLRYPRMHDGFLLLFIAGFVLSAIFVCAEFQRLGIRFREHRVLRVSFWIKLAFIILEIALAVAFIVMTFRGPRNPAAIVEWVIALIFTFWVLSFFLDLLPASRRHHRQGTGMRPSKRAEDGVAGLNMSGGHVGVVNDSPSTNGYSNGSTSYGSYTRDPRGTNTHGPYTYTSGNVAHSTTTTTTTSHVPGGPRWGHEGASQGTF